LFPDAYIDPPKNLLQEIKELKSKLELYENGVIYSSKVDELQNKIDKAIEYIESNPKVYVYDDIIYVNDIIEWENSCAEINKTEFIKTLLKILKGSDE
jgi:hypothetical protein